MDDSSWNTASIESNDLPRSGATELVSNGGAFGGKEDMAVQPHAVLLAHMTGRPVRLTLTRGQSIRVHPKRHPIAMDYEVGCDADGQILAVRARMIGDSGAYASVGAKVLERAAARARRRRPAPGPSAPSHGRKW